MNPNCSALKKCLTVVGVVGYKRREMRSRESLKKRRKGKRKVEEWENGEEVGLNRKQKHKK